MRRPGLNVVVEGTPLPGAIAAEIESRMMSASRFRLHVADSPAASSLLADPSAQVAVSVGVDGAPSQLVLGRLDSLVRDPLRGLLELEGRDLAALLIDSRPQELFVNRTAGDIAEMLATAVGLTCDADVSGTTIGRFYGSGRDRLALPRFARAATAWDQLASLAAAEGLRVWVDGAVLRLRADDGGVPIPLDVSQLSSVRLNWQPAIARGVEVAVASWGTRLAQAAAGQAGQSGGLQHRIVRPNLTQDEAQQLASQAHRDIMRHERTIDIALPGELAMRAGGAVELTGIAAWDGIWRIAHLRRTLDVRHGFKQFVRLEPS